MYVEDPRQGPQKSKRLGILTGCSFSPRSDGDKSVERRPWKCVGCANMDANNQRQETQEPGASKTPRGLGRETDGLLEPTETWHFPAIVGWELCSRKANESCPRTVNSLSRFPSGCGQMDLVPHRLELWSDEPNAVRPAQVGVGAGKTHIVGAIILVVAVKDWRGFVVEVVADTGGLAGA